MTKRTRERFEALERRVNELERENMHDPGFPISHGFLGTYPGPFNRSDVIRTLVERVKGLQNLLGVIWQSPKQEPGRFVKEDV